MVPGSQWTAIWYRGEKLVHFETIPWNGGENGVGYTDWIADPAMLLPGDYIVHIFVGKIWRQSGQFRVVGEPPPLPNVTPPRP